ncbi:MAG: type II toxin-antitoxin system RelE/ParE family toxin [Magnetococcales bacterium]|nr:type II toxin-antitoxin system RelE/ParE family toxin [Magnetococcales bacterium]
MGWQIDFGDAAKKDLARLDKPIARRIVAFLRERVATLKDPRTLGEALKGSKFGSFWKYRVGDYRIVCSIEDSVLRILAVRIGSRRDVYR